MPDRRLVLTMAVGLAAIAGCGRSDEPTIAAGPTVSTAAAATTAPTASTTSAAPTTAVTTSAPGTRPAPPPRAATTTTRRSTTTAAAPASATGVTGTVTAGPTCGNEPVGRPCPPVPVAGTVEAVDGQGRVTARAPIDAAGGYALAVPPGRYTLHVAGLGRLPTCPDTPVDVGSAPLRADISCDTGIR